MGSYSSGIQIFFALHHTTTLDWPDNELKVLILTTELEIVNWSQIVVWQSAKKTVLKVIYMNMLMKRLHRD